MPRKTTAAPFDIALGARIRVRRRALHLSQSEVGERVGVTFQQLQKYERGANRVSCSTLALLAPVLRMTCAELMGEDPRTGRLADPAEGADLAQAMAGDGLELATTYQKITSPRLRKALVKLAEAMAQTEED